MNTESTDISVTKSAAVPSIEFLRDLADVLEKHRGGIDFVSDSASNEIGFYITQGGGWDAWKSKVWIGWPKNGESEIRSAIKILEARLDDPNEDVPEIEEEKEDDGLNNYILTEMQRESWDQEEYPEDSYPETADSFIKWNCKP